MCLFNRGDSLPHLGVLLARRAEVRFRLFDVGRGLLNVGRSLGDFGSRTDAVGFGQRSLRDEVGDDLPELLVRIEIHALLVESSLGRRDIGFGHFRILEAAARFACAPCTAIR